MEDDPVHVLVLYDFLSDRGYQVTMARNGKDGFTRFVEDAPHLMIIDVQLPLESYASGGLRTQGYLLKPFEIDDLLDHVPARWQALKGPLSEAGGRRPTGCRGRRARAASSPACWQW